MSEIKYETVIGLEVHVELKTKTKLFCGCRNQFGGAPNAHCCPGCIGMPGTLPVPNKQAILFGARAGLATGGTIGRHGRFERKHYFYPDLPDGFQLTQSISPISAGGYLDVEGENPVRVRINHIHVEADAGKLLHGAYGGSLADLNRAAVPLIEIVTEPDMRTKEQAKLFLEKIKAIMQTLGVSDCKMQEGSLRCDVNVSVRKPGEEFGVRTEMKNLNSFRAVERAIEYESGRHIDCLETGEPIYRQTRRWDDEKGVNYAMRSKEVATDYRYLPEPNLPEFILSDDELDAIKRSMPELPDAKRARFVSGFGLAAQDAQILVSSGTLSALFEQAAAISGNARAACNWIVSDVLRLLKEKGIEPDDLALSPEKFAKLLRMVDKGEINITVGKGLLGDVMDGADPEALVKERGLAQVNDTDALLAIVCDIIDENPQSAADYKSGKEKALAFFVGQAMKATKGKANPQLVNKLIIEELGKR